MEVALPDICQLGRILDRRGRIQNSVPASRL